MGDLAHVGAVVEDDAHAGAECLGVAGEGGDFVDVEVTVFDLADASGG